MKIIKTILHKGEWLLVTFLQRQVYKDNNAGVDSLTSSKNVSVQIGQFDELLSVFACVSHGVLGDMARDRISGSSIERVLTSDTVPMAHGPKVDCVSVGDLLGHAVQRIHDGESVSSLFDI